MGIGAAILIGTLVTAGSAIHAQKKQEKLQDKASREMKAAKKDSNQMQLNANKADSELDEGDIKIGGSDRSRRKRRGTSVLTNPLGGSGSGSSSSGLVI
jgi:hypothetical protein